MDIVALKCTFLLEPEAGTAEADSTAAAPLSAAFLRFTSRLLYKSRACETVRIVPF